MQNVNVAINLSGFQHDRWNLCRIRLLLLVIAVTNVLLLYSVYGHSANTTGKERALPTGNETNVSDVVYRYFLLEIRIA